MSINAERLAYASNHDGRGDLNCLAHVLAAHIRTKRLPESAQTLLYGAYRGYKASKGVQQLANPEDLLKKIAQLTPVQVEKEITPILESLRDKDSKKSRLNTFIKLANSLGIKVEVYGAEFGEEEDGIQGEYVDFIPSKNSKLSTVTKLRKEIEDAGELGDVAFHWNGRLKQTEIPDGSPKIKLFLKRSDEGSCDFYFEYPIEGSEEEETDEEDDVAPGMVSPEEALQYTRHNEAIRKENERVKKAREDEDKPLSFSQGISMLVTLLGGIFAKFVEVCLGALSRFQGKSFGDFNFSSMENPKNKTSTDVGEPQEKRKSGPYSPFDMDSPFDIDSPVPVDDGVDSGPLLFSPRHRSASSLSSSDSSRQEKRKKKWVET